MCSKNGKFSTAIGKQGERLSVKMAKWFSQFGQIRWMNQSDHNYQMLYIADLSLIGWEWNIHSGKIMSMGVTSHPNLPILGHWSGPCWANWGPWGWISAPQYWIRAPQGGIRVHKVGSGPHNEGSGPHRVNQDYLGQFRTVQIVGCLRACRTINIKGLLVIILWFDSLAFHPVWWIFQKAKCYKS